MQNKLKQSEALFAEGKIEDAEKCFFEILSEDPKNKEAHNNLGVIAFQRQDTEQAILHFTRSLEIDPFYKDAILNYCDMFGSLNLAYETIPFLEKVVQKYPDDREYSRLLHDARLTQQPRKKIAVLCLPGLQSFLGDIVDYLKTGYNVQTCYSNNNQEIESAIKWADIVWLEWANELAVALTSHPTILNGKRVICRLHSYEAFAGYAAKIKWGKISDLLFVAGHIRDIIFQQVPGLADDIKDIHIVPNGVSLDKFSFKQRANGKNLAYVGHINYKKGPMLLLHAFWELVQEDSGYRLFIAGNFQDIRYELYFNQMIKEMNLANNIQMDGWVDNISDWLENKQYLVCTSVLESQNMSIMEAMACGLKPIIHNFVGAKKIYPEKYVWSSIDEFVQMVLSDDYNSREYRDFIKNNYSLDRQLESLDKILSRHNGNTFDYSEYWNNRLKKDFSVTGVGHIDYSPELNEALYADRLYLLDFLLETHNPQYKSVLEIDPGTGFFTKYFFGHKNINNYLGVDITEISVNKLTEKFGKRFKFKKSDFASPDALTSRKEKKFDIVFAAAILLHIVSDNGYRNFVANISRALKDGGIYIGMEPISFLSKEETGKINVSPHNRIFRWEELNRTLEENGLILESLIPLFSIMNTPFDAAKVGEVNANALNSLVVASTKRAGKNQDLINAIRFIDKNLIAEYQTGLSEWAIVCRKGKVARETPSTELVAYNPLLKQLSASVEKRNKIPEVDSLLKSFESEGYNAGRIIDHLIPYQKKDVKKFISLKPIELVTIKVEEINNETLHIDMLLRNSDEAQLFAQNLVYVPTDHILYSSPVFDPLKNYIFNLFSKLKLTTGSPGSIKSYIFDEKLKKDIRENELAYTWERAYPGTQFMHFNGLAIIARRYLFAQRYIDGKDVLEAAGGFGYGAASFSMQAASVVALDIAEENINFGKKTYGFENVSWRQGDITELPFSDSSFDTYVSFETIEHLNHAIIPVYLSEASRVLRMNGTFIISTPNRKTREGRINNPYHISEMYYEQLNKYLKKSFKTIQYYSTKGIAIYFGAYPSWADGFIAVCSKCNPRKLLNE